MRLLKGLEIEPAPQLHRLFRGVYLIVFALEPEMSVLGGPQPQDHFQSFPPLFPNVVHSVVVDSVKLQICGQRPEPNSPVDAATCDMIQHCDSVGSVDRMMQRQHGHTRGHDNVLRQGQCLGHEQLGHRGVLPSLGDVLTDPCLGVPKLIRLYNQLDVTVVGVCVRPPGGVQRHHKQSEFHYLSPMRISDLSS